MFGKKVKKPKKKKKKKEADVCSHDLWRLFMPLFT